MTKKSNELIPKINSMICSKPFQDIEYAVRNLSLFSIVGTTHIERWHSAFIAWLLNPVAEHGLDNYALKQLLVAMHTVENDVLNAERKLHSKFPSPSIVECAVFEEVDVMPDTTTTDNCKEKTVQAGGKKCSFDIALTATYSIPDLSGAQKRTRKNKLLLIIENKVKAAESHDQTTRYEKWAENPVFPISSSPTEEGSSRLNNLAKALLFLTPLGAKPAKSDVFISMSYQHFTDMVLIPCLRNSRITLRGRELMDEYLEALSDAGYCLIPRDRKCAKEILSLFSETLDDMILAASQVKDDSDDHGGKGNARVTLHDLAKADLLSDGDEFELLVGERSGEIVLFDSSGRGGFLVDGEPYQTPSASVKAILGEHVTYNGWECFRRVSDSAKLVVLRKEYIQGRGAQEEAEKIKSFSPEACQYADSVLRSRSAEFELLERALKEDDSSFSLPVKYTTKSWKNFDYSLLKERLDLDDSGGVPAYFKGEKGKAASVSCDKKPYRISCVDFDEDMSALAATRKMAKAVDQVNDSNSYRWAQYWCVTSQTTKACRKFNDKTFVQVYETLVKLIG